MSRHANGLGSRRMHAVTIEAMVGMLQDRAEDLARALLPHGRREGREWVDAHVKDGGLGDSMRVHLEGRRAGVWAHFAAGRKGDALDLVAYLVADGDKGRALGWCRRWLGIDDADPAELERRRRTSAADAARRQADEAASREQRRLSARGLWLACKPSLTGTPSLAYLRGRGLDLAALGRQPGALRHGELTEPETKRRMPTLAALVQDTAGQALTMHRTFLAADTDPATGEVTGWRKAGRPEGVSDAKKVLGPYGGGFIALWRGASGKPLAAAPAGDIVAISEGIEDGLSVAIAAPELRVIAAISLGNMGAIALPPAIGTVIVVAQNDPALDAKGRPHPTVAAFERALRHLAEGGRTVKVARPPAGIKDVNDLLRAG